MAVRRTGFVRARKAAGFTQESFAEVMHVDRSTVARWERGTREPVPYLRPKLARLLKITMNELDELLHSEAPSGAMIRPAGEPVLPDRDLSAVTELPGPPDSLPPTIQPWFSRIVSGDDEQEALELVRRVNASEPFSS